MTRICSVCNKSTLTGFSVSHSHRRTKRRFKPNLFKKQLPGMTKAQLVCAKCFKATLKARSSRAGSEWRVMQRRGTIGRPRRK